jgi:hypothetical protein
MINEMGLVPAQKPDPNAFEQLLNLLSSGTTASKEFIDANRGGLGKAARYAPGASVAVGELAQGDVMGALGAGAGAYGMGQVMKRVAGGIPATTPVGMLAKGALYAGGSLFGSSVGAQLGSGVGALGNQLIGGTQNAVGDAANAIAGAQREAGTAAGTGKEAGLGGMSQQEVNMLRMYKELGVNMPAEAAKASFQITNKMKDRDVGRQMQMNQQLAGLTAQLQRNLGGMQLAGSAMNIGGQLTSQMLTSNPYQASVLQTGGIRGPLG